MPKITVIVPVYKVENYLSACIDSILAQTFKDFELILIDDGSPDNSGIICDNYAKKDRRVSVIHQVNQGLSSARNAGLDIAKGEYITFIDSDDVVTNDFLNVMFTVASNESVDITICEMFKFEIDSQIELNRYVRKQPTECLKMTNKEVCIQLYRGGIRVNAWGKLYKTELFEKRRFPFGRVHEDQAIVPLVCYEADSIVLVNLNLYGYRIRPESITREKFSLKRYDDVWAVDSCIEFFESKHEDSIIEAAKEKRQRLICTFVILARKAKCKVPKKYKISIVKALYYLKKHNSDEYFEYYLAMVSRRAEYLYEYIKKLRRVLKR